MIICLFVEVSDKQEEIKVEQAMAAPFVSAGCVSNASLEDFDSEYGPSRYGAVFAE